MNITEEDLKKTEEYHYKFQQGCYFSGMKKIPGATLVWSDTIKDYYWNYAGEIDVEDNSLEKLIEEITSFFKSIKRRSSLYISPFSKPEKIREVLESKGLKVEYKDAWMFFEREKPKINLPEGFAVKKVETDKDREILADLFDRSHTDDPSEPYGKLPPEYKAALLNFAPGKHEDRTVIHYLGFYQGIPASFGTLIYSGKFAGIYNVGTLSEYRKKGLGTMITLECSRRAVDAGVKTVFLQTEKDTYNERLYHKMGFSTKLIGEGWVLK